jgi:hypothetical protein
MVVCSLMACSSGSSRSSIRGRSTAQFLPGKRQCFIPDRAGRLLMGGGVTDPALACFSFSPLGAATAALSVPSSSAASPFFMSN